MRENRPAKLVLKYARTVCFFVPQSFDGVWLLRNKKPLRKYSVRLAEVRFWIFWDPKPLFRRNNEKRRKTHLRN